MAGSFHHLFAGVNHLSGDIAVEFGLVETHHGCVCASFQYYIFGREVGKGQGLHIGQAPGTLTQVEHTHIFQQFFFHQWEHHIDKAGFIGQDFFRLDQSGFFRGGQFV